MIPAEDTIVRQSITVDASQERAFATFTSGHDRWWPREFHIGGAEMQEAVMEQREGGRWYERDIDGSECEWGKVLVWEPPSRLVLAWQITGEWAYDRDLLTEIEVRFLPEGPDRTRVELEHRGLDAYGDAMDHMRGQLESGWPGLLAGFAAAAQAT
ncbi:MAG: SRPBCC family protein [Gaiellales bacterium]